MYLKCILNAPLYSSMYVVCWPVSQRSHRYIWLLGYIWGNTSRYMYLGRFLGVTVWIHIKIHVFSSHLRHPRHLRHQSQLRRCPRRRPRSHPSAHPSAATSRARDTYERAFMCIPMYPICIRHASWMYLVCKNVSEYSLLGYYRIRCTVSWTMNVSCMYLKEDTFRLGKRKQVPDTNVSTILMYINGTHQDTLKIHIRYITIQ